MTDTERAGLREAVENALSGHFETPGQVIRAVQDALATPDPAGLREAAERALVAAERVHRKSSDLALAEAQVVALLAVIDRFAATPDPAVLPQTDYLFDASCRHCVDGTDHHPAAPDPADGAPIRDGIDDRWRSEDLP